MNAATWWPVKKTVPKPKWSSCHNKVRYWNKWLRRTVRYAAARYEPMARYFSGVVSRLCIRSLHAVVTVLFYARLNIQGKMRVENQTKTRVWELSGLCPETSTKKNVVQEFHLWIKGVGNILYMQKSQKKGWIEPTWYFSRRSKSRGWHCEKAL